MARSSVWSRAASFGPPRSLKLRVRCTGDRGRERARRPLQGWLRRPLAVRFPDGGCSFPFRSAGSASAGRLWLLVAHQRLDIGDERVHLLALLDLEVVAF